MYTVGIDIGASSVKVVALDEEGNIRAQVREPHRGAALPVATRLLGDVHRRLANETCAGIVAVGAGAQALAALAPGLPVLEEVPAATLGARILAPEAACLMCVGGQNAYFISLPEGGGAPEFATNDSCASGTGSFFEDQMTRLGLRIEDYSDLALRAQSVPRLSGRCTVFAKTDIIHRQQEGVPVEDILQGLCHAMVKTFKAMIVRGTSWRPPLALAGGVVLNAGVVRAVREVFKLGDGELIATPDLVYLQAVGAAVHARDDGSYADLDALRQALVAEHAEEPLARREPLPRISYDPGAGYPTDHLLQASGEGGAAEGASSVPCALGVDVGSTSTNLVLVGLDGQVLDAQYLRTRGNPRAVVAEGLASIGRRLGDAVEVVAVGSTGSGRALIGEMIGADAVRDEITAQARAAAAADPEVDTVFEIGGQDSKFIHLKAGQVDDFQMNKVCAAGTGSFVEEQAARLGIPLADYGELALSSAEPVDLGERCTVFVETAIHAALAKGASHSDIAAGLCQSIVRNYLYRVVGGKRVGHRIVLQGGVAYNAGIVAAFKQYYGDELTVSPWFAVSGAVGVALLALEEQGLLSADAADEAGEAAAAAPALAEATTGMDAATASAAEAVGKAPAAADDDSRRTAFRGFYLERAATASDRAVDPEEIAANRAYFHKVDEMYLEGYDPVRDPAKKTVGIPRCLMIHKLFPMVNGFFKQLGYNVVLSDASTEETVRLAQQSSQGEVCYPVKLIYGHMTQLLDQGVDYIFFPSLHTIRHEKSKSPHNYACTYMQTAPAILARELDFEGRGVELLSPLLEMDWGQEAMAKALLGVGAHLGHTERESARAMLAGGFALREFSRKTEELGAELLASLKPDDRVIVIIARQYDIQDPALNMGIPDALLDRGCKVITLSHLQAHDVDLSIDYPGVCWPFGQHIVSGAKLVRRDPRLFAVYLTNHGCGPDTMISHYFREEMGDKPYLQIEMDEHYSKVGVITRLEAFLNAIEHHRVRDERDLPLATKRYDGTREPLRADEPAYLPGVGLFGDCVADWMRRSCGVEPTVLAPTTAAVAEGKEGTDSKEYLTFAATLGMSLAAAREAHGQASQLLLPSTEGAEADSQYDRVVRTILDERGVSGMRIVAPRLEQLPWVVDDAWGLFVALVAADVCYAAPAGYRAEVAKRLLADGCSVDAVATAAREVASLGGDGDEAALSVVGEWPLVYSEELTGDLLVGMEEQGRRLVRMPLSEYLLFLWLDSVDADRRERSTSADVDMGALPNFAIPTDEKLLLLKPYREFLSFVSGLLGPRSSFAPSIDELRAAADASVGAYRGGNGRYRSAKLRIPPTGVAGTVAVASMYENTDIMLRLREGFDKPALPTLHLEFDGVLDKGLDEKLGSFLYYL